MVSCCPMAQVTLGYGGGQSPHGGAADAVLC